MKKLKFSTSLRRSSEKGKGERWGCRRKEGPLSFLETLAEHYDGSENTISYFRLGSSWEAVHACCLFWKSDGFNKEVQRQTVLTIIGNYFPMFWPSFAIRSCILFERLPTSLSECLYARTDLITCFWKLSKELPFFSLALKSFSASAHTFSWGLMSGEYPGQPGKTVMLHSWSKARQDNRISIPKTMGGSGKWTKCRDRGASEKQLGEGVEQKRKRIEGKGAVDNPWKLSWQLVHEELFLRRAKSQKRFCLENISWGRVRAYS